MDDLESFFVCFFFADEIWNILWRVDLYGASVLFISSAGDGTHSDQSDKKSIYNQCNEYFNFWQIECGGLFRPNYMDSMSVK